MMLLWSPLIFADDGDHKHHVGHSDALLFLLQHKIAVTNLQQQLEGLSAQDKKENLIKQGRRLRKAMPILQQYMATPESRYPNMEIYHQSLQSRSALLADYTQLLVRFQLQSTSN